MVLGELVAPARALSRSGFIDRVGGDVLLGSADAHQSQEWLFETVIQNRDQPIRPDARMMRELIVMIIRRVRAGDQGAAVLVGRATTNDICIPDESVSKLHARLFLPGPRLADADSSNGTLCEDTRLEPGDMIDLHHGYRVQFGRLEFRFYRVTRLYDLARTL